METDPEKLNELNDKGRPSTPHDLAGEGIPGHLQWLYVKTLDEENWRDIRDSGESVDDNWAQGWAVRRGSMRRQNYEECRGVYVKSFPSRYNLHEFPFSKNMKRILARNRDLDWVVRPLRITPAKEKLYLEHSLNRFKTPPKEPLTKQYADFLYHPAKMMEMCFFDDDDLIAFSIFELGDTAMSSHAGIWSPKAAERSLGTFTILKEIEWAKANTYCNYYYIGPYHQYNNRYHYKARFPGFQLYDWDNDQWIKWEDPYIIEMLEQELPLRNYAKAK
jgi:arginine-tRNA-protein transferase